MEGHGKPDKHGIHLGGGAFDQGTTDNRKLARFYNYLLIKIRL